MTKELKKKRVSVPLREDIYQKVEEEADKRGISMPTYIAFVIADHMINKEKVSSQLLSNVAGSFDKQLERAVDNFEKTEDSEKIDAAMKMLKEMINK